MEKGGMVKSIGIFLVILALTSCGSYPPAPVVDVVHSGHSSSGSIYRVQPGDTLYSIAWSYSLDYRALAAANTIRPPYALAVGQSLNLNISRQPPAHWTETPPRAVLTHETRRALHPAVLSYRFPSHVRAWVWPAQGRLIEGFRPGLTGNNGINIANQTGTSVVAAASGEVVYAGSQVPGYGKLLILKHNPSLLSAYAYNEKLLVKEGSWVTSGQTIAKMGHDNSGKSMLHFEIRNNGRPVDPLLYLK
ncbi:MAG TPA: peptidoglycan DD-metalloendopeptidase family protein [Coxiellaceae bacterium]|nr:peptidoglycan DD-metalloendopeptidase family protein [Coxiellaceae bacterium]